MAINNSVDDYQQLNAADDSGDWTTQDFDAPQDNNSASTFPIYLEGTVAQFWALKKGITTGYTYTNVIPATVDITNKVVVGFITYPFADIDNIPITLLQLRVSSDTGFTTNYRTFDALAQISSPENVPISGFTPVMGWYSGGVETGTFVPGSVDSIGWVATTGNDADGKQGGFEHFFAVGYVGAHSQTFTDTFLSDLYDEWYDNNGGGLPGTADRPLAVLSQASDFFQTNVRFALGDGTGDTANIVVSETAKTIFFNNLESDHELGWLLTNPSGANQLQLTLTNCVMFWNDQDDGVDIFDGVANADIFRIDGCSFSNGGNLTLAAHISDANTYVQNCSFSNCQRIEPDTMLFKNNVISDTAATAANSGALEIDSTSNRVQECTFTKGTAASHAIVITTAGTYSLSDLVFNGYNAANGNNDSTIRNESGGSVTINATNITGNLTFQNGAGSTTTINQTVTVTITVQDTDGNPIQGAKVFLEEDPGGTDIISYDITNASGQVTASYAGSTPQDVTGFVRKGTSSPVYKAANINDTIGASGLSATITLVADE